jgi:hypothetical protein
MLAVPPELTRHDEARLVQQNMVTGSGCMITKWLRYYLDFRGKYSFAPTARQSLPAFQDLGFLLGMDGPPRESSLPSAPLFFSFRLEQAARVGSNRGLDGPRALAEATAETVAAVREPPTASGPQSHGVRHRVILTLPAAPFVRHLLKPCLLLQVGLSLLANKNNYMNLTK